MANAGYPDYYRYIEPKHATTEATESSPTVRHLSWLTEISRSDAYADCVASCSSRDLPLRPSLSIESHDTLSALVVRCTRANNTMLNPLRITRLPTKTRDSVHTTLWECGGGRSHITGRFWESRDERMGWRGVPSNHSWQQLCSAPPINPMGCIFWEGSPKVLPLSTHMRFVYETTEFIAFSSFP